MIHWKRRNASRSGVLTNAGVAFFVEVQTSWPRRKCAWHGWTNKKTEQKGTDDEIAIRDEEWMPFAAIGYFVVCPFLAILYEDDFKKVPNWIPKNHWEIPLGQEIWSCFRDTLGVFVILKGLNNKAQGCGTPLPWVGSYPPIPVYPNGVTLHWCKYCIRKPT